MIIGARHIALALLGVVVLSSPASAQCAWVLWIEESRIVVYKRDERPPRWTLVGGYASRSECEEGQRAKVATLAKRERAEVSSNVISEDFGTDIVRQTRVICVPDTIDPRGPKVSVR